VHLEASTKPHIHQKFQIFWTNIAFTMACPNFKNGPKNGLGPLGVKKVTVGSRPYWKSTSKNCSSSFHRISEIITFKHQSFLFLGGAILIGNFIIPKLMKIRWSLFFWIFCTSLPNQV
jgi:hypothetical protein